jgi:5-methylcytosine-specific restriction protein A
MHTGTKAWQAIRQWVLQRDMYQCQACKRYGNHVDHVDGDSWHNPTDGSNWQTLCLSCHAGKTASENSAFGGLFPRWIPRPRVPVLVVCGPPGSGKSTWCEANANGRPVVCLDTIAASMGYTRDTMAGALPQLIAKRNAMLSELVRAGRECILIATLGKSSHRRWWQEWGAEVLVINPGADVCASRIYADPTRSDEVRRNQLRVIQNWM